MRGAHLMQMQKCPACGYVASQGHINFCDGNVVLCDLCPTKPHPMPITKDYHSVYQHYMKHHDGQKGELLEGMKQGLRQGTSKSPRVKAMKAARSENNSRLVPITIVLPFKDDKVRCHFVKSYGTWMSLARQGLDTFNTKDQDELALMCAIATFKIEYNFSIQ